jgi:hypothetical protein
LRRFHACAAALRRAWPARRRLPVLSRRKERFAFLRRGDARQRGAGVALLQPLPGSFKIVLFPDALNFELHAGFPLSAGIGGFGLTCAGRTRILW